MRVLFVLAQIIIINYEFTDQEIGLMQTIFMASAVKRKLSVEIIYLCKYWILYLLLFVAVRSLNGIFVSLTILIVSFLFIPMQI